MKKATLFLAITLGLSTYNTQAQGCSDAGFCTLDMLQPNGISEEKTFNNQFKVGLNFGKADNEINAFGQYLEYKHLFSDTFSLDAKLTALSQSGNNISNFGLSDFYINGNFKVDEKTSLTTGFKIPLSDANGTDENGFVLPMDYQPSLGTFDLILGIAHKIKNFSLALGYQQPLSQNKNAFFAPIPTPGSDETFFTTNEYERAGDILLRISYPLEVLERFKITPSLLPIYHLSEDKVTINNIQQSIAGSDGLTLNANAYFDYKLNDTNALQLSLGIPLAVRDARPDGLTRKFVANIEYIIKF